MPLASFIISIANFFLRGFTFMLVWNWFPHELFKLPTINLAGALGLLIIAAFFHHIPKPQKNLEKKDAEFTLKISVGYTIGYLIVIGVSYLIHLFI